MLRGFVSEFFSDIPEDFDPFFTDSAERSASDGGADNPTINDDFVFKIDSVSGESAYSINESEKTVVIDPEHGDWDAGKRDLKEFWSDNGRVFSESAFELYLSINSSKNEVDEVCEFFEPPIISDAQYAMLKQAYHTSIYFNEFSVSEGEEDRRRKQLADQFGSEAMNVPSLCSAGYFDESGAFRKAYKQLSSTEAQNEEYQELFGRLIRDRPFVIFVRGGRNAKTTTEIYDLVIQKSRHLDDLPVDIDYIHLRGIGKYPREKIRDVREMLNEHHDDINTFSHNTERESGSMELVVVIDNDTI